jgi:acyl-CoA thioester hydrolase
MSATPPDRPTREAFPVRYVTPTRWRDDDVYGHMNNVVYYEYFDTAVNRWLLESGALQVPRGPVVGLVAETSCRYFASVGFPDPVETGLSVARIGRSSVVYALALFGPEALAAAACRYVHVYVDAVTRRPTPLPEGMRSRLETIRGAVSE